MDSDPAGESEDVVDAQALHDALLDLAGAADEHFGDREPSEEELRAFLRQRLIAEGKSEAEADAAVRDL